MSLLDFLESDVNRSLFPLCSAEVYTRFGEPRLRNFVYTNIFGPPGPSSANFLSAPVGYALKDRWHIRKLLVLDPLSTFVLD
ncbi:MAG: hypothetical protein J0I06_12310 [Planctomycetes bacterium]|nr:hypothetical protein [Planctomycetota bacterium]